MKEKVYIRVKGLQFTREKDEDLDEEAIEIIQIGSYKVVNGKEYIRYDEVHEEDHQKSKNLIKISGNTVEITKKGAVTAHLSFVEGEKTMTCYNTPYGNIYLGIFARKVAIEREEERIHITIDYSIEMNYEQVADSLVEIEIGAQELFSIEKENREK